MNNFMDLLLKPSIHILNYSIFKFTCLKVESFLFEYLFYNFLTQSFIKILVNEIEYMHIKFQIRTPNENRCLIIIINNYYKLASSLF